MNALAKRGLAAVVLIGTFSIAWSIYFPHSPWGKQEANLRIAEKHRPKVEESLRLIPGAEKVRVGVYTGLEGSLQVSGDVADERTAEAVMSGVLKKSPPVTLQFLLIVGETNIIRKVVKR